MRFLVMGTDQHSGERLEMFIDAPDAQHAAASAARRNIVVQYIGPTQAMAGVPQAAPPPGYYGGHGAPQYGQGYPMPQAAPPAPEPSPRVVLGLLLFLLPLAALFSPPFVTGAGVTLAGLVLLYMLLSPIRSPLRWLFRVSPRKPVRGAFKLTALALWGVALILCGFGGRMVNERQAEYAAQRQKEEAERAKVVTAATTRVGDLLSRSRRHLEASEVAEADRLLAEALSHPAASNMRAVRDLRQRIEQSGDRAFALEQLTLLPDADFEAFRTSSKVPNTLNLGFAVLTDRVVALAKPQVAQAATVREEQRKQAAAEAAERKRQEIAAAEAKRKEEAEKLAAEKAREEKAQQEIRVRLNAFMAVLEKAEVTIVRHVSVRRQGDVWRATLKVDNIWHIKHKQIRLQDAQSLWKAWAAVASPNDPDKAYITIVDGNDNEVGGSRILAGSLIWVQD